MISAAAIANWDIDNVLRSMMPLDDLLQLPFRTVTGLNADNTNAGYKPARNKVIINTIPVNIKASFQLIVSVVSNSLLKYERPSIAIPIPRTQAIVIRINDSKRN